MKNYYVTFGSDHYYYGGWIIVRANSMEEARSKTENHLECCCGNRYGFCALYSEKQFQQTRMYAQGNNLGAGLRFIVE